MNNTQRAVMMANQNLTQPPPHVVRWGPGGRIWDFSKKIGSQSYDLIYFFFTLFFDKENGL